MKDSKLIKILKSFSREEIKMFEKFLSSPFFASGRNLLPLFKKLKKYYPLFNSPNLTEQKIYSALYPDVKFKGKTSLHKLRVLFSEMVLISEKFLVYHSFESGNWKYYYNICLADAYRNKYFTQQSINTLLKNSEIIDLQEKDNDYFYKRLELNMFLSGIYFTISKFHESYKYSRNNLLYIYSHIFDLMNKYVNEYNIQKYNYNIEYKGFEQIKYFIVTFDAVAFEKEIESDDFETKNLTLINYYIIKSRIDENDKDCLLKAAEIFLNSFNNLSRFWQWNIFALLFNRFFGRVRFDSFYLHKANELIDFVWSKGVFSTHKKLFLHIGSYHTAMNIKAAVSNTTEFNEFIERYSGKIDPEYHEDINKYSLAIYMFKDKSFNKCLELVSKKDSLNIPSVKIYKHKLKICSLFELKFFEETLLAIDTFEHYLRKNKDVSEIVKTENIKFTGCIKKLVKMKHEEVQKTDVELNEMITLTQNSLFGYWFKEKLGELQK